MHEQVVRSEPHVNADEVSFGDVAECGGRSKDFHKLAMISPLALAVAGCGGGESAPVVAGASIGPPAPNPTPTPSPTPTGGVAVENAAAARFLLRASFSASPGAIEAIMGEGKEAWLDRHLRQQNDQSAEQYFVENGFDAVNSEREFASERQTDRMLWTQLMAGGNAVRKRVALALSEFFVISATPRLKVAWPSQAVGAFWDLLNEGAFGNFRDLLEKVSLSPAMGTYLDTIGSRKDDSTTGRVPDENFAREVMQLFSIGLYELNLDGSLKTSNGEPIETYGNSDVVGLARVFTGYNLDVSGLEILPDPNNGNLKIPGADVVRRPMTADPRKWLKPEVESQHSLEAKSFLGATIPAGTGAADTMSAAMDVLFTHPNVGPFFCQQMIQRLVTSNPSPSYVARVARIFNNNGSGVRGDLFAVFKAILLDSEAETAAGLNDMRFGKLREPIVRFVQFGRTFNLYQSDSIGITRNLSNGSELLGQAPFRAVSVFNFFRPTYVPTMSVTLANEMVGPEFQLVNETSVAGFVNFLERTVDGRGYWLNDLQPNYSTELEMADNTSALIDRLDLILTAGQLRDATRRTIAAALDSVAATPSDPEVAKLRKVRTAVMLILASNDYLVQK